MFFAKISQGMLLWQISTAAFIKDMTVFSRSLTQTICVSEKLECFQRQIRKEKGKLAYCIHVALH